jgi:hypothetical protein
MDRQDENNMSEWLVFNASNFSATSWREQVTFDEMMQMSALYKTNTLSWIVSASLLK